MLALAAAFAINTESVNAQVGGTGSLSDNSFDGHWISFSDDDQEDWVDGSFFKQVPGTYSWNYDSSTGWGSYNTFGGDFDEFGNPINTTLGFHTYGDDCYEAWYSSTDGQSWHGGGNSMTDIWVDDNTGVISVGGKIYDNLSEYMKQMMRMHCNLRRTTYYFSR